ncbi:MCE family protein [Gordonia sp. DT30]|uniref:MCE family protein n=1 Tax=unclassified Gordonia (in: high G+C Gram-positive bacteria) TaxID=2657482 RepID=UPI003CF24B15
MALLRIRGRLVAALLSLATVVLVAGCGSNGIQSIPLPGGVDVGDNPRTYTIQFSNILDLVTQSAVKQNGVAVGRVTKVEVPDNEWYALVTIKVKNEIDLSDQARAAVQQTSLLGEKFVALDDPAPANAARQAQGQPIPMDRTRTATDIEQVLGALSMLLNGGGINQLQPIVTELNKAFDGRADNVKSLLHNASSLIAGLNRQRDDIISAIDGLNTLSSRANAQTDQINRILQELPAGVAVLEEQRPQFVDLLTKLDKLGQVGTNVLGRARDSMITDLKALRPVLTELSKAAPDLITAAPLMLTHPFPDSLLPAVQGDSTNLFMTLDLRTLNQLEALGVGQGNPVYSPPKRHNVAVNSANPYYKGNGPRYGWPTITLLPPNRNSRPGPNTPPSGGTYPASFAPVPGHGQGVLDGTLAQMGMGA